MDSGEHFFCACGAQFHGYGVLAAASIIAEHKARGVNYNGRCGELPHETFKRHWRCGCSQCQAERMVRRKFLRKAKR